MYVQIAVGRRCMAYIPTRVGGGDWIFRWRIPVFTAGQAATVYNETLGATLARKRSEVFIRIPAMTAYYAYAYPRVYSIEVGMSVAWLVLGLLDVRAPSESSAAGQLYLVWFHDVLS